MLSNLFNFRIYLINFFPPYILFGIYFLLKFNAVRKVAETICSVYTNEHRRRPAIEFKLLEQELDRADN
ncbi:hypothetical protein BpHYR1_004253 [Brachionus plicatilis]|uniref:Uncharacterized protein n=1 Tax=Brachionus plicatilis TaxID=10195 RepID=A0A3M7RTC8_BRAPC|nr:hypothetical protein BpHYR1_004253 [Brachionus plicatilis]